MNGLPYFIDTKSREYNEYCWLDADFDANCYNF